MFEIIDSKAILNCRYNDKNYMQIIQEYNDTYWKNENYLTEEEIKTIEYVVHLFENAKFIGSLLKVEPKKYIALRNKLILNEKHHTKPDYFTFGFFENEFKDILRILRLADYLSQKYDVVITNPPYLRIAKLDSKPKSYLIRNYPDSKTDMFSMFMEALKLKEYGFRSIVNPDSWMFLKVLRTSGKICRKNTNKYDSSRNGRIDAVVQTTLSFVKVIPEYRSTYYRLVDSKLKNMTL